jgi:hypothetical protein
MSLVPRLLIACHGELSPAHEVNRCQMPQKGQNDSENHDSSPGLIQTRWHISFLMHLIAYGCKLFLEFFPLTKSQFCHDLPGKP